VKLNSIHNSLDSSLAVIKVAETPKYYNFMMDKFKGLVFSKYKQLDSSNFYFKRYLVSMPEDGDVFFKLANNYLMQENKKDALLFAEKVKDLYKVNAKVDTLIKKIKEL